LSENTQVALLIIGLLALNGFTVAAFLHMYAQQARDWQKERQLLLTRIQAPEAAIHIAHDPEFESVEELVNRDYGPLPDLYADRTE
jgi:hypothetical protein